MEKLLNNLESVIDVTQTTASNPNDVELDLILRGEASNASSLKSLRHKAHATTSGKDARATGLKDTQLVTRNLANIDLDVAAHASDAANWGWGFKNVQLEGERNRVGMAVNINVIGSTTAVVDKSWDPTMGMDSSQVELSSQADIIAIRSEADARDFSNLATAYGINGGHVSTDKIRADWQLSKAPQLRKSLIANGGDDNVTINTQAANTGQINAKAINRDFGKQRAVGIFNSYVDLGTGHDTITLRTEVLLSNPAQYIATWNNRDGSIANLPAEFGWWPIFQTISADGLSHSSKNVEASLTQYPGASSIRDQAGLFDGPTKSAPDLDATGAADLYEAALDAGDGDDKVNIYNGWESDIHLGAGDDAINLSAGKELFIIGGAGNDIARFATRPDVKAAYPTFTDPVYKGTQKIGENTLHVVETFEGNVYLDSTIEVLSINGVDQALSPIKGAEPVTLSIIEGSTVEGNNIVVQVRRSGPLNGTTIATLEIASGTAEENADFQKIPAQQITFAPGQTIATATFRSVDDKEVEPDETVKVTLAAVTDKVVVSTAESVFTLTDNDKAPSTTKFSVNDLTVEEGKPAIIVITRQGDTKESQSVQITTRSQTASGLDIKGGTCTASFLPDELTAEVAIETTDDEIDEPVETVQIVGGSFIGSGTAVPSWAKANAILSITDNDAVKPTSTFKFKESSLTVEEGKRVTITVERTGDTSTNQFVQVKTVAGENSTNEDFEEKTETLLFSKGETSKSFTIRVPKDSKSDTNEQFHVVKGPIADTGKVQGSWAEGNVTVTITEPALVGQMLLQTSENAIDEGATMTVNITGQGLKPGSKPFFRISGEGITEKDFDGALTGPVSVASNGTVNFVLNRTAIKDFSSDEQDEVAKIQIFEDKNLSKPISQVAEVIVNNTSIGEETMLNFDGSVDEFMVGTAGPDKLIVSKAQSARSFALWGLEGKDSLVGGNRDDFLIGGAGVDTLTGGRGSDRFILEDSDPKNFDTITDFNPKEDSIAIPVGIFDATTEDIVDVVRYRDISNRSVADRTFEQKQAGIYVLVDTLANIKRVNSTNFSDQIYFAVDTKSRKLMMDDDGNWFRGSTTLATFGGKGQLTSLNANNFVFGFDFGSKIEDEEPPIVEELTDPLA